MILSARIFHINKLTNNHEDRVMSTIKFTHKNICAEPMIFTIEEFKKFKANAKGDLDSYSISFEKAILSILAGESHTAIGICSKLGFTGYNKAVYDELDSMVEADLIAANTGYCDTEYSLVGDVQRFMKAVRKARSEQIKITKNHDNLPLVIYLSESFFKESLFPHFNRLTYSNDNLVTPTETQITEAKEFYGIKMHIVKTQNHPEFIIYKTEV